MATLLYPATEFGVTDSSTTDRLATYSERNPIGVEVPAATPADLRGPNEQLRYLRSVGAWADVEHTLSGVHDSLQIPRVFLSCSWNGVGYDISADSYSVGTYQRDATVFSSVVAGAAGEITVTLGASYALPSATNYRAHSAIIVHRDAYGTTTRTHVVLRTITSTTVFALRRFEGVSLATLALDHGHFSVAIYSVA